MTDGYTVTVRRDIAAPAEDSSMHGWTDKALGRGSGRPGFERLVQKRILG